MLLAVYKGQIQSPHRALSHIYDFSMIRNKLSYTLCKRTTVSKSYCMTSIICYSLPTDIGEHAWQC